MIYITLTSRNSQCRFVRDERRLHILVNNAGVMATPETRTEDGVELQMGVNHFGPFLLTNLLLRVLKASAPSRIINVASNSHFNAILQRNDLNSKRFYDKWNAYRQSKLAMVMFTRELSKRLARSGVSVNSLNPGVANTELTRYLNPLLTTLIPLGMFQKRAKEVAQNVLYVALDPQLRNVNGRYFDKLNIVNEAQLARNDTTAAWMWKRSAQITGLGKGK